MIDVNAKPLFQHDCDGCVFLGVHTEAAPTYRELTDIYWCPRCDDGTLIRRYDTRGDRYSSYPHFVWASALTTCSWLREAVVVLVQHLMKEGSK